MIRHLPHSSIDKQKWDACISDSRNRIPYALSWWLDAVCPGWDALVQDDYLAVMPLTHGHKFGIDYLYQPYFTQQLGIFSLSTVITHRCYRIFKSNSRKIQVCPDSTQFIQQHSAH